jgi:CheY-like chemotaxis protein
MHCYTSYTFFEDYSSQPWYYGSRTMYTSDRIMSGIAIFFIAIVVLVGVAAAIVTAIHYYKFRRRRISAMAYTQGLSMRSANAQRMQRYVCAEESDRDPLDWSAAAHNGVSADSHDQSAGESRATLGKGKTILIADDDPVVVYALSRRFQQLGFQVIRSPDATHALMGAMKVKPDLIILDINMPSGNGLAVCEMMASDPRYAGIPVIIHSMLGDEATRERCRRLGAWHVEKSSNSWAQIKSLVETLIGKGGGKVDHMETMPQAADVLPRNRSAAEPDNESAQPQTATAAGPIADVPVNHLSPEKLQSTLPAESSDVVPERISPACGHGRILCIDGPQGELELLQNRLSSLGVEVTRISDLDEGFWSCFTEKPHLVVIQSVSSGKVLKDFLHRFTEHPLTRNFPVLFINQDNALSEADLPTSDNFKVLQSPIVWKDLLRELEKVIPIVDRQDDDPLAKTEPTGKETDHAVDQAAGVSDHPLQAGTEENTPLTILCIDDDPVIAKSVSLRLNRYGIEVKGAENGTVGYLQAVSEKPDLIFLDLTMPSGDGHYALAKLREHPRTKDIPVIMLTVETHPGVRRQMLGLGAAGFLSKPVRWNELFAELGRHVPLPKQLIIDYKLPEDQLVSV